MMDEVFALPVSEVEWDCTKTFTAPVWVLWKLDKATREVYLRLIATAYATNWKSTPNLPLGYLCDVILEASESTVLAHLAALRELGLITWSNDGAGGRTFTFHHPPLRKPQQAKRGPKARRTAGTDKALTAALSDLFAGAPSLNSRSTGSALDPEGADAPPCGQSDCTTRVAGTLTWGHGRSSEYSEFDRNCKHTGYPGAAAVKGHSHG